MNAPEIVEVAAQNTTSANVEQHIIAVDAFKKRNLLERLIVDLQMNQVIVFCSLCLILPHYKIHNNHIL